jgi:hypothetical protein
MGEGISFAHKSGRYSADRKLKALTDSQNVLQIKIGIWLRNPSKQSRADVDEAIIDLDEVVQKIVGG